MPKIFSISSQQCIVATRIVLSISSKGFCLLIKQYMSDVIALMAQNNLAIL